MQTPQWIGTRGETFSVGQSGYLIHQRHILKGYERWVLALTPARTNQSNEPKIHGEWCGTTNDLSVYGFGRYAVVQVAKNGRARIRPIPDTKGT
jgi:hypothetical protein